MDICLDQDARPVLIEVNGLPDLIILEQLNAPLLADRQILKAFAEYDLLVSNAQRRLIQCGASVASTETVKPGTVEV